MQAAEKEIISNSLELQSLSDQATLFFFWKINKKFWDFKKNPIDWKKNQKDSKGGETYPKNSASLFSG